MFAKVVLSALMVVTVLGAPYPNTPTFSNAKPSYDIQPSYDANPSYDVQSVDDVQPSYDVQPVFELPVFDVQSSHDAQQSHRASSSKEPGMPFNFGYTVKDEDSGVDFAHNESSDGHVVSGSYRVALPDGRTQIVTYTADHEDGYMAEVTYEGEANYPDPKPYEPKNVLPLHYIQ